MTTLVPLSQGSPASPSYAFFTQDAGGWWAHKGIYVDKEAVISLISRFKNLPNVRSILVVELPGGHKAYEWEV